MGNSILNKSLGKGKFFLVGFFRTQNPVLKFFWFFDIKGNAQLAKSRRGQLAKKKKKIADTSISDE